MAGRVPSGGVAEGYEAARERAVSSAVASERPVGGHRRFPVGFGC